MTAAQNLAKFAYSGTTIYIANIDWKNNWTNGVTVVNQPTTGDAPNTSGLINLNKVEDRYTITGYLDNGKHSSETYTKAIDKKNGLKTMFGKGNVVTLTLEGTDIDGAVDKYEIAYTAKDDYNESQTGEVIYDVVISFVKGGDLV